MRSSAVRVALAALAARSATGWVDAGQYWQCEHNDAALGAGLPEDGRFDRLEPRRGFVEGSYEYMDLAKFGGYVCEREDSGGKLSGVLCRDGFDSDKNEGQFLLATAVELNFVPERGLAMLTFQLLNAHSSSSDAIQLLLLYTSQGKRVEVAVWSLPVGEIATCNGQATGWATLRMNLTEVLPMVDAMDAQGIEVTGVRLASANEKVYGWDNIEFFSETSGKMPLPDSPPQVPETSRPTARPTARPTVRPTVRPTPFPVPQDPAEPTDAPTTPYPTDSPTLTPTITFAPERVRAQAQEMFGDTQDKATGGSGLFLIILLGAMIALQIGFWVRYNKDTFKTPKRWNGLMAIHTLSALFVMIFITGQLATLNGKQASRMQTFNELVENHTDMALPGVEAFPKFGHLDQVVALHAFGKEHPSLRDQAFQLSPIERTILPHMTMGEFERIFSLETTPNQASDQTEVATNSPSEAPSQSPTQSPTTQDTSPGTNQTTGQEQLIGPLVVYSQAAVTGPNNATTVVLVLTWANVLPLVFAFLLTKCTSWSKTIFAAACCCMLVILATSSLEFVSTPSTGSWPEVIVESIDPEDAGTSIFTSARLRVEQSSIGEVMGRADFVPVSKIVSSREAFSAGLESNKSAVFWNETSGDLELMFRLGSGEDCFDSPKTLPQMNIFINDVTKDSHVNAICIHEGQFRIEPSKRCASYHCATSDHSLVLASKLSQDLAYHDHYTAFFAQARIVTLLLAVANYAFLVSVAIRILPKAKAKQLHVSFVHNTDDNRPEHLSIDMKPRRASSSSASSSNPLHFSATARTSSSFRSNILDLLAKTKDRARARSHSGANSASVDVAHMFP